VALRSQTVTICGDLPDDPRCVRMSPPEHARQNSWSFVSTRTGVFVTRDIGTYLSLFEVE